MLANPTTRLKIGRRTDGDIPERIWNGQQIIPHGQANGDNRENFAAISRMRAYNWAAFKYSINPTMQLRNFALLAIQTGKYFFFLNWIAWIYLPFKSKIQSFTDFHVPIRAFRQISVPYFILTF